jgi:hypothetical protein
LFAPELSCMPGALDGIGEDAIMVTDLASVQLTHWVRRRVVLLGDAAHAFEPHTGLGASMAMEDARVALAQKLTRKIRSLAFIKSKAMRFAANRIIPFLPERLFLHDYFTLLDGQIDPAQPVERGQIP